jgi:phage tail tape-measure protein
MAASDTALAEAEFMEREVHLSRLRGANMTRKIEASKWAATDLGTAAGTVAGEIVGAIMGSAAGPVGVLAGMVEWRSSASW